MRVAVWILGILVVGLQSSCSDPAPSAAVREAMAVQAKLEQQSQQSQQELLIFNQQMDELWRQCDAVFAGLRIGMRERDVQNQQPHGRCARVHSIQTARGTRDEWVWEDGSGRHVYFNNGVVSEIRK